MAPGTLLFCRITLWGVLIGVGALTNWSASGPSRGATNVASSLLSGDFKTGYDATSNSADFEPDLGGSDSPFVGPEPEFNDSASADRNWAFASRPFEPTPQTRTETRTADGKRVIKVRRLCRVTAYCDRGTTAAGVRSGVGQCAAPGDIPLGASVFIPELGRELKVTDRTHKRFRHNTVDIFMPVRQTCLRFGRRYLECEFTIVLDDDDARPSQTLAAR